MAATKTDLITERPRTNGLERTTRTDEGLTTLLSRLGEDVMDLVNSQLALFKVEIKEEANAYARGAALIGIGARITTIDSHY
jgi:uncharacterized membrane protein YqjE